MYIARALSKAFQDSRKGFPAVMITGPRQSGKTTFLRHEAADAAYVSFDDPMQRRFAAEDPNGFLDQFKDRPLAIDEAQYVPELFSYLKMRIDARRGRHGQYFLTGSQQFQMMKHLGDSLAGRISILELYPFSHEEVFEHKRRPIEDLLWLGGYPDVVLHPQNRDAWFNSYIQTYVQRDVRQLQNVQDLRSFETFLGLCAARHGQCLNRAEVSRDCGVSQPALKDWESVLYASYIIRHLPPYFQHFGKRLVKTPKLYFADSGLAAWLTRQPAPDALFRGAMGGAFFEGLVVMEAYKALAEKGRGSDLYFWRSHDGLEVDLLIQLQGKILPVEIKQTATPRMEHIAPLQRFIDLAGPGGSGEGLVVCCVSETKKLSRAVTALSWKDFPGWLRDRLS